MKSIIKRIIVGVAIGVILGFINACEVKALTTDSINNPVIYKQLQSGNSALAIQFNGTPFQNYGGGYLIFNFYVPNFHTQSTFNSVINVHVMQPIQTCEIISNYAYQDKTNSGNFYTAKCPVNFTNNNYLKQITFEFLNAQDPNESPYMYIRLGYATTFYSADTMDSTAIVNAIISESSKQNTQTIINQLNYIGNQQDLLLSNILEQLQQDLNVQQSINQNLQETNDFLKDTSSPSTSDMDFSSNNTSNNVISDLVTMPIRLVQSFLNGFNSSCKPFNLGNLFGTDLVLPCINIGSKLGVVWTIIDTIISGLFIYVFGKSCVKKFNDITNMKDNQIDEVFD